MPEAGIEKLYIEPTSRCNLRCENCFRLGWDETTGDMDMDLLRTVLAEAKKLPSLRVIFFGGIGEPLFYPGRAEMLALAKASGRRVEVISNGVLLGQAQDILLRYVDCLWISFDNIIPGDAKTTSHGEARLDEVTAALRELGRERERRGSPLELAVNFVVSRQNANQLAQIEKFADIYSLARINISNLLPRTPEFQSQALFTRSLDYAREGAPAAGPRFTLPHLDIAYATEDMIYKLLFGYPNYSLTGEHFPDSRKRRCRFIAENNAFLRWDGEVCPCMALLHSATTWLFQTERHLPYCSFGNLKTHSLAEIWDSKPYADFRARVRDFPFSPCTLCGGCDLLESNREDCMGNPWPVCGGCLWAHGFISCP
ncbi:MAG: SPASM domain-containing protein [Gracilibacteraceae bacterium]|jgi:MoaA/NifB/PqqE/SkfB family radical SAM enzyme|nr:SPASM domain-containing protein [Gracilibacteraceae bacterium]